MADTETKSSSERSSAASSDSNSKAETAKSEMSDKSRESLSGSGKSVANKDAPPTAEDRASGQERLAQEGRYASERIGREVSAAMEARAALRRGADRARANPLPEGSYQVAQRGKNGNLRNPYASNPQWQLNNSTIRRLEHQILDLRPNTTWMRSTEPQPPRQQLKTIENLRAQLNQIRASLPQQTMVANGQCTRPRTMSDFMANARATFGESNIWTNMTVHRGEVVIQRNDIPLSRQNTIRMENGNAPFVRNSNGQWELLNLHHVSRREGGMIEVLKSQNVYNSIGGGPLHIPGLGGPIRQPGFSQSYWRERLEGLR